MFVLFSYGELWHENDLGHCGTGDYIREIHCLSNHPFPLSIPDWYRPPPRSLQERVRTSLWQRQYAIGSLNPWSLAESGALNTLHWWCVQVHTTLTCNKTLDSATEWSLVVESHKVSCYNSYSFYWCVMFFVKAMSSSAAFPKFPADFARPVFMRGAALHDLHLRSQTIWAVSWSIFDVLTLLQIF